MGRDPGEPDGIDNSPPFQGEGRRGGFRRKIHFIRAKAEQTDRADTGQPDAPPPVTNHQSLATGHQPPVTNPLWLEVRRVLGKLLNRTSVYELPMESSTITPSIRRPQAAIRIDVPMGENARSLSIPADVKPLELVAAEEGGGGVDLAAVAGIVSADEAFGPSSLQIESFRASVEKPHLHSLPILGKIGPRHLPSIDMALVGGSVSSVTVTTLRRPSVNNWLVRKPQAKVKPPQGTDHQAIKPHKVIVRSALQRAFDQPIVRRSELARRGGAANPAQHRRLVAAAGVPPDRVVLIGSFTGVPVTNVARMTVDEQAAALLIWLRPDAATATVPPRRVRLLVGRDTQSRKLIQTVV